MTLAASLSVRNWPILVGDIMISAPARGRTTLPFNIPTHGNVNARAIPITDRMVSGLVQKATLITPQLGISWADSEMAVRSVIRDILDRSRSPTFEDVESVLNSRRGEPGLNLYLAGIFLGEARLEGCPFIPFAWDSDNGWESRTNQFPEFGDCYAGGTGAQAFLGALANPMSQLSAQMPDKEYALCLTLSHLARLAGDQIRTGAGISRLFGGAFEIVTLMNDQLQKVDDVAFHFWEARRQQNNHITITFNTVLKVAYFEDYLVIRKLEFGGEVANAIRTNELYILRSARHSYSLSQTESERLSSSISAPSMNARYSVFYTHLPDIHRTHVFTHRSTTPGESRLVQFQEDPDQVSMQVHPDAFQRIRHALNV